MCGLSLKGLFISVLFFGLVDAHAQLAQDTIQPVEVREVVVVANKTAADGMAKPLATIDQYLEKSEVINMIRRGPYAWEPFLNGMSSERSVITVDGMRIYAACTDKMDPVTSYVEVTNLSKVNIHSGQSGSAAGSTIAGSIDLVRKKGDFGPVKNTGSVFSGFDSNNKQRVLGTGLTMIRPKVFADIDFTYRHADNYKAGGNREILYSQFTKWNTSAILGYKLSTHRQIELAIIYDHATDVGYPALPMDVSLARGLIGSVEYIRHHSSPNIALWKTKFYYNKITHVMDDTQRPDVPIRMDMPGWSETGGFYSSLEGNKKLHQWKINLSGHSNQSLAEMTMFSNNSNEKDMFMLTWPGVKTNYMDFYGEDVMMISDYLKLMLNGGIALHTNRIENEFGYESLKIFYPEMPHDKSRILKRLSAAANFNKNYMLSSAGIAYGERAPSVSEGYGFYLFNSFDRFDYIGNPEMKNERSLSANAMLGYVRSRLTAKISGAFFRIHDYIIGRPHDELIPMTIGASGIKVYEQLEYADLWNLGAELNMELSERIRWTNKVSFRRGVGSTVANLPLIQPLSYNTTLTFKHKTYSGVIHLSGASEQKRFNPEFGESELPDYCIVNVSASKLFEWDNKSFLIKLGVDNLLDSNYTTFADWNRLPRMGRNVFVNVIFGF